MNSKNRVKNNPIVPKYTAQSQQVGIVHSPRGGQKIAVQARHHNNEALQPHARLHDQGDNEQRGHVLADFGEPQSR